jgi:VanZ family protein
VAISHSLRYLSIVRRVPFPLLPAWLRWTGVLAVAAVIVYFSVVTSVSRPPSPSPWWDKQLHFIAYGGFALAMIYATARMRDHVVRRAVLVIVVSIGFGIAIELAQAPLANRYATVGDVLANSAGVFLAASWLLVERRLRYRRVDHTDIIPIQSDSS